MGDAFVDKFSPHADEFSVWPFLASAHRGHCVHTSMTAHCAACNCSSVSLLGSSREVPGLFSSLWPQHLVPRRPRGAFAESTHE